MKLHLDEFVNIKTEDDLGALEPPLSSGPLRSLVCTSLRRVIEQCWHQVAVSPKLTLDDHRQFLRGVEERLRRILALLETGCDARGDDGVPEKRHCDEDDVLNKRNDEDDVSRTRANDSVHVESEPQYRLDDWTNDGVDHRDETDSSEKISRTKTKAEKNDGLLKNGKAAKYLSPTPRRADAFPPRSEYDDNGVDRSVRDTIDNDDDDNDDDDEDFIPSVVKKKTKVRTKSERLPPRHGNIRKLKKGEQNKKTPPSFSSGDKSRQLLSQVGGCHFQLKAKVTSVDAALSAAENENAAGDAVSLNTSLPSSDKTLLRDEMALRRLLLVFFDDVYRRNDAEKAGGDADHEALDRIFEENGRRPSDDVNSIMVPEATGASAADNDEIIECRVCDVVVTSSQLLKHHASHVDKERAWRMKNRGGNWSRAAEHAQHVPCPWCGQLFIDDRHLVKSGSRENALIADPRPPKEGTELSTEEPLRAIHPHPAGDTSASVSGASVIGPTRSSTRSASSVTSSSSSPAPQAEPSFLRHVFERHPGQTPDNLGWIGADSAVILVDGEAVALDFVKESCYCLRCFYKSRSLEELRVHIGKDHLTVNFENYSNTEGRSCLICNKLFDTISRFKRHVRLVHREKNHPCAICGKLFKDAQKAKRHLEIIHLDVKRTCEICGKTYNHDENLRSHQRVAHGAGPQKTFPCKVCGKVYNNSPSLHYHKTSQHLSRRFSCRLCDVSYYQRRRLNDHVQRVHEGLVKRETCQLCGRHFTEKGSLKKHLESTHGSKKFPCVTCGKEFARASGLHAHVASAHLGKRYECDRCCKSFTQSGTLTAHKRNHHGTL